MNRGLVGSEDELVVPMVRTRWSVEAKAKLSFSSTLAKSASMRLSFSIAATVSSKSRSFRNCNACSAVCGFSD